MSQPTLRIGLVSVVRPLFKGDATGAAERSLLGLRRLGGTHDFTVVAAPELVTDAESAERMGRELAGRDLDFLLIQHATFATGDLLVPLLGAAKRVGVWALSESAGGRGATGPLPLNALCGLNMTLSYLDHPKVNHTAPTKWFYGEVDSDWFVSRLEPTLTALRGMKAIDGARILQVGGTAPNFYGIEERPTLGSVTVETMELAEVFERVAAVPEGEGRARATTWQQSETLTAPPEHLERTARIELALRDIARTGDYDAIALRCWPEFPDACEAMACGAVASLGDHNIPTACEGDVMGALSMLALQGLSQSPTLLMDLSDVDEATDSLLFWHCGNGPKAWAGEGGTRLTTHFNRDGTGVVRDMTLRPGRATGFRLLDGGDQAVVVSGEFGDAQRASFDGVRGWLSDMRWNGGEVGARAFVSNVLDYRLPHHLAFGMGELTEATRELCGWLGAKVLEPRPERTTL
ncbi:MAG: hypothetical protein U5L04_08730 [Trueperaceae bacterium]|nr:hypothetical protein [Trueperaceae bacterium]